MRQRRREGRRRGRRNERIAYSWILSSLPPSPTPSRSEEDTAWRGFDKRNLHPLGRWLGLGEWEGGRTGKVREFGRFRLCSTVELGLPLPNSGDVRSLTSCTHGLPAKRGRTRGTMASGLCRVTGLGRIRDLDGIAEWTSSGGGSWLRHFRVDGGRSSSWVSEGGVRAFGVPDGVSGTDRRYCQELWMSD